MIKIGCSTYSYNQYMKFTSGSNDKISRTESKMGLEDFLTKAYELRLDGVELTAYYFPSTESSYLRKLKRQALSYGLDLSAIAVGNNFCIPSQRGRDEQKALVKKWIEIAMKIGAPCLRVFAGPIPLGYTEEDACKWTIDALKLCAKHAEKKGVVLALENHGGVTSRADTVLKILEGVGSEWVRHLLDTGNYHEPLYEEIKKTAPYAVHIHVRQEEQIILEGKKRWIDYQKIKKILNDVGYNGYLSIEYEGEEDPITGVPKTVNCLKAIFI